MLFKDDLHFLSNFHPARILYKGTFWKTVEHAYQAEKCKDLSMNEYIWALSSPQEAKMAGRRVELRSDWESVKVNIMADLVLCKFTQDEELKQRLLDTGDLELEEGNYWHDNFWGNCYCEKCKNIKGENVLGIILMEVRDYLRQTSII